MRAPSNLPQAESSARRGAAWSPGTCGELAQGRLDGIDVMVTCPIDLGATATVDVEKGTGRVLAPADAPKARRAVEMTLAALKRPDLDAVLRLETLLPRSKGMASSTADVVAAIAATSAALGTTLSPRRKADLALAIEPSDGLMLPGIALFDHIAGRIARSLGPPPPMRVLVLEFAGEVDTQAFNAQTRIAGARADEVQFREALDLISAGLAGGDPESIGRGATLSSLANQAVLPKSQLPAALELGRAAGAVGVNVAHSGTVIGLLFDADADRNDWAARAARQRLPGIVATHDCRIIGGGIRVQGERGVDRSTPVGQQPQPEAAI
jgi:L-threonine kinase